MNCYHLRGYEISGGVGDADVYLLCHLLSGSSKVCGVGGADLLLFFFNSSHACGVSVPSARIEWLEIPSNVKFYVYTHTHTAMCLKLNPILSSTL